MLKFGEKGTIDGFVYFEINRFVPRGKDKADIEFSVFYQTVYGKHEKRTAKLIDSAKNIYEFKYRGSYVQFEMLRSVK